MKIRKILAFAAVIPACLAQSSNAWAIPSFSAQTNQPCSACHVGAFGPQLKPYGRDFKLGGYTASDRPKDNIVDNWYERITTSVWASYNRTNQDTTELDSPSNSPGGKGYGKNDNFSFDQAAIYFGGRITPSIGAIQEITYDGVERAFTWDALDLRYSHDGEMFGEDATYGVMVGNQLGNTSVWNSTPPNGFPYNQSRLIASPQGSLVEDTLNGQVMGPGVFMLWNNLVYADASVYFPLSHNFSQAVGLPQENLYVTPIPFWHIGLQQEFDHHQQYAQIGMFGASANRHPGSDQSTGTADHISDIAAEANYQYMADMHNMWSAHATYIHEDQDLKASRTLFSTNPNDHLDIFKADVSYTIDDTWTPSLQYFRVAGSKDANLYNGSTTGDYITSRDVSGSPNSEGFTIDLGYVPFGKPDSSVYWGNMRLAVEYTAYTMFNGSSHNASDNNMLFVNFMADIAPFVPFFSDKSSSK